MARPRKMDTPPAVVVEQRRNKNVVVTFRIMQSISYGVFALGLSMMGGEWVGAVKLPFSNISVTLTVFGLIGAIITGIQAKNCETW